MSDDTRTDQGHAFWKQDLKRVAEARIQAKGRIAQHTLWVLLVESWAVPVVAWLSNMPSFVHQFDSERLKHSQGPNMSTRNPNCSERRK